MELQVISPILKMMQIKYNKKPDNECIICFYNKTTIKLIDNKFKNNNINKESLQENNCNFDQVLDNIIKNNPIMNFHKTFLKNNINENNNGKILLFICKCKKKLHENCIILYLLFSGNLRCDVCESFYKLKSDGYVEYFQLIFFTEKIIIFIFYLILAILSVILISYICTLAYFNTYLHLKYIFIIILSVILMSSLFFLLFHVFNPVKSKVPNHLKLQNEIDESNQLNKQNKNNSSINLDHKSNNYLDKLNHSNNLLINHGNDSNYINYKNLKQDKFCEKKQIKSSLKDNENKQLYNNNTTKDNFEKLKSLKKSIKIFVDYNDYHLKRDSLDVFELNYNFKVRANLRKLDSLKSIKTIHELNDKKFQENFNKYDSTIREDFYESTHMRFKHSTKAFRKNSCLNIMNINYENYYIKESIDYDEEIHKNNVNLAESFFSNNDTYKVIIEREETNLRNRINGMPENLNSNMTEKEKEGNSKQEKITIKNSITPQEIIEKINDLKKYSLKNSDSSSFKKSSTMKINTYSISENKTKTHTADLNSAINNKESFVNEDSKRIIKNSPFYSTTFKNKKNSKKNDLTNVDFSTKPQAINFINVKAVKNLIRKNSKFRINSNFIEQEGNSNLNIFGINTSSKNTNAFQSNPTFKGMNSRNNIKSSSTLKYSELANNLYKIDNFSGPTMITKKNVSNKNVVETNEYENLGSSSYLNNSRNTPSNMSLEKNVNKKSSFNSKKMPSSKFLNKKKENNDNDIENKSINKKNLTGKRKIFGSNILKSKNLELPNELKIKEKMRILSDRKIIKENNEDSILTLAIPNLRSLDIHNKKSKEKNIDLNFKKKPNDEDYSNIISNPENIKNILNKEDIMEESHSNIFDTSKYSDINLKRKIPEIIYSDESNASSADDSEKSHL